MTMVRHDAELEVVVKSGNTVLERQRVEACSLGGALTVISFMYNRLSMSGGVAWWNPATGESIAKPQVSYTLVNESDILAPGQDCPCPYTSLHV